MNSALPDAIADEAVSIASFRSTQHPGRIPRQWAFALSLIRPLTVCMLPLMIAALLSVLQGFPALKYLTVGFPLAIVIASLWTVFRMQASLAEIHVRPGAAAVVSLWRAVDSSPTLAWKPIYEIRTHAKEFAFGLGDASYELARTEWPDADTIVRTLRNARNAPTAAQ